MITTRLVASTIRLGAAQAMLQRSDAPDKRRLQAAQDAKCAAQNIFQICDTAGDSEGAITILLAAGLAPRQNAHIENQTGEQNS